MNPSETLTRELFIDLEPGEDIGAIAEHIEGIVATNLGPVTVSPESDTRLRVQVESRTYHGIQVVIAGIKRILGNDANLEYQAVTLENVLEPAAA